MADRIALSHRWIDEIFSRDGIVRRTSKDSKELTAKKKKEKAKAGLYYTIMVICLENAVFACRDKLFTRKIMICSQNQNVFVGIYFDVRSGILGGRVD